MMRKIISVCIILFFTAVVWSSAEEVIYIDGVGGVSGGGGGGTAAYRDSTENTASATTTWNITEPAGVVSGDLLIVFIFSDAAGVTFSSSGWTEFADSSMPSSSEHYGFWKIAAGSESDWDFTASISSTGSIQCFAISKTAGTWTDPATANYSSATSTEDTSITTSSVTGVANCVLLCSFVNDGSNTVTSPPADMTLREDTQSGTDNHVSYSESRSAGSVTKSITWSASDQIGAIAVICAAE